MLKKFGLFGTVVVLFLSLPSCDPGSEEGKVGIEYRLVKSDSITVEYPYEFHGIAFDGNRGAVYNFRNRTLSQFDKSGHLLRSIQIPEEGSGAMGYIHGLRYRRDGSLLIQSINGEVALLDSTLSVRAYIKMPYQPSLPAMRSNVKSMDSIEDWVYVYFPGRGRGNPFENTYLKNNPLLERIDLTDGGSSSVFHLSEESKFQQDQYHDTPYVLVAATSQYVYFALDNEPLIHRYNALDGNGLPEETYTIGAEKFVQVSPKPIPLGNIDGVLPGMIDGLFAWEGGFALTYGEGLEKSEMDKLGLIDPKRLKSLQRNVLKFHMDSVGWSKDIVMSPDLSEIVSFSDPQSPIYALKNTAFQQTESRNTFTLYELKLENSTGDSD